MQPPYCPRLKSQAGGGGVAHPCLQPAVQAGRGSLPPPLRQTATPPPLFFAPLTPPPLCLAPAFGSKAGLVGVGVGFFGGGGRQHPGFSSALGAAGKAPTGLHGHAWAAPTRVSRSPATPGRSALALSIDLPVLNPWGVGGIYIFIYLYIILGAKLEGCVKNGSHLPAQVGERQTDVNILGGF